MGQDGALQGAGPAPRTGSTSTKHQLPAQPGNIPAETSPHQRSPGHTAAALNAQQPHFATARSALLSATASSFSPYQRLFESLFCKRLAPLAFPLLFCGQQEEGLGTQRGYRFPSMVLLSHILQHWLASV